MSLTVDKFNSFEGHRQACKRDRVPINKLIINWHVASDFAVDFARFVLNPDYDDDYRHRIIFNLKSLLERKINLVNPPHWKLRKTDYHVFFLRTAMRRGFTIYYLLLDEDIDHYRQQRLMRAAQRKKRAIKASADLYQGEAILVGLQPKRGGVIHLNAVIERLERPCHPPFDFEEIFIDKRHQGNQFDLQYYSRKSKKHRKIALAMIQ